MQIAIISDTHDNIVNLSKALDWIKKNNITTIIHCGDVTDEETLKFILSNFDGEINLVYGNIDSDFLNAKDFKLYKNLIIHGEVGELKINNKKIAFCHFPGKAKELALSKDYDMVFYGHTHKPWQEQVDSCMLINPGTLSGMFSKSTFAVYDSDNNKLELKLLEKI